MAGDWIKMRTDLYRDPKVCLIADELLSPDGDLAHFVSQNLQRDMAVTRNVMRNVTVGALVTVWGVMRLRGKRDDADLICSKVTLAVIDDLADLPGFGCAMAAVGWAVETPEGVVFPRFFDDYNVDPTDKKASKSAERQRRWRDKKRVDVDVTRDVTRNVTVTHREEKSREEKKEQDQKPSPSATQTAGDGVDGDCAKPANLANAKAERARQVTADAIAAFNATLAQPIGLLPAVRPGVGTDTRIKQVRRCIRVAREICADQFGAATITPEFWAAYFAECARDPFKSGQQSPGKGHENWSPSFEYLTREAVMLAVFDKATSEAAA